MTTPSVAPRVDWRFAIACVAALTVLFGVQQWISPLASRPGLDLPTSLALQGIAWGVWLLLLPLIVRAARRHPLEGRPGARWLLRFAGIGAVFSVVHSAIAGTIRWSLGLSVTPALGDTIVNGILVAFAANMLRYSAILVAYQAVVYHTAVRERDRRAARLELDLARETLANIESRLQPHFLFNTLNAIAALVREDPDAAERMIGQLSDLLRASLGGDPMREIALDDELAFVAQYLEIEQVRFQDRLRVTVQASAEARRALVPHLVVQPLVENAVRHGIAPLEGGGSIVVSAERQNGRLRITVSDDGVGVDSAGGAAGATRGAGIGLHGLRTRLAHLYGSEQRVDVSPRSPKGTLATLELPYRSAP